MFATQNPIELEGTYPLPEAQLDRFMFDIVIDYLPEDEEVRVVERTTAVQEPSFEAALSAADIVAFQRLVRRVCKDCKEPIKATRCKTGSAKGCTGRSGRCITHDLWEELGRHIHLYLNSVTLADIINGQVLGSTHAVRNAPRQNKQAELQPVS